MSLKGKIWSGKVWNHLPGCSFLTSIFKVGRIIIMITSITLTEASRVTGFSITDLYNSLARGALRFVGSNPGSGRRRAFGRVGLTEIALLKALQDCGLTLQSAAQVIQVGFMACRNVELVRQIKDGNSAEDVIRQLDSSPESWLSGPLDYNNADLNRPVLWVIVIDSAIGPTVQNSDGWDKLPSVIESTMQLERPYVSVLNVTAVLVELRIAVATHIGK